MVRGQNIISIDCETGGLSPTKTSLLTIGIVFIRNGAIRSEYEWNIKHPTYNVTPYAMKVNGIDLVEHDKVAISSEEAKLEILELIKNIYGGSKPIVLGHNVAFDLGFIHNQLIPKEEWEKYVSYRNVDTCGIARFLIDCRKLPIKKAGLSDILEHFNMGNEDSEGRHTALWDAKKTFEVYKLLSSLVK